MAVPRTDGRSDGSGRQCTPAHADVDGCRRAAAGGHPGRRWRRRRQVAQRPVGRQPRRAWAVRRHHDHLGDHRGRLRDHQDPQASAHHHVHHLAVHHLAAHGVVVTDLDGGNQQTVGIGRGGGGMTLSPDGTKLYVALVDSDGIAIIDLATYAVDWYYVGTHDGVPTCPRDVAWAAGQLWFGWGCDNAPAGIGKVDPETRAYDLGMAHTDSRIVSAPLLATVPSQPNILIAGETGTNPALLFRFEATPTQLNQQVMSRTDGGSVRQLAVTPDGSQVIVPSGSPYYHPVLSTADLTEVHQYPTTAYPNAAAVRSDGLVAAGSNAAYDKDVFIFEPGGSTPIATYEFGHLPDQETWAHTLVDGGLAWSGDRIYAVTHILSEPDNVTLRIRTLG